MGTTLPVYRRSALQLVSEGCLKRFRDIYIDGVDDSSDLSLIGTGGHAVKHAYIKRLLGLGLPADGEEADEAFIEGIAVAQIPTRLIPVIREPWRRHSEVWELQIEKFVAAEESQIAGQMGFTPDLVLAHPDANELEIVDSKWGWDPPMTEAELQVNFQARMYSRYALDRWPNFARYRFTIEAIRFNKYVSVVFNQSDLDAIDLEVRAAITSIEYAKQINSYPAVAGPACRFCQLVCPVADQEITLPKRFVSDDLALGAAAWLMTKKPQVAAVQKVLKSHVAGHGPVSVNGVVWDNRETVSKSYPASAVVKALERIDAVGGLDAMPDAKDLTISQSALKALFKRFPKLQQELEPLAREKSIYRFSAKRPGEEEGEDE